MSSNIVKPLSSISSSANIPSHLLPLTSEEQSLLDLYSEVKALERLAKQAAADAAKAKLVAANEEFQRNNGELDDEVGNDRNSADGEKKKKKKRVKKNEEGNQDGLDENDENIDEGMSSENESDDEKNERERRRLMKLQRLRDDVNESLQEEQKKEEKLQKQEDYRKQLLGDATAAHEADMPSLRRRERDFDPGYEEGASLISNMYHTNTPPHEFSKSLDMSKVSGMQLFPNPRTITPSESSWSPPEDASAFDEGCLELELPDFDANDTSGNGNNTLAIKFTTPEEAKRFSINIAAPDHNNYYSVLFHFNPRHFERGGQVVINDKKLGVWGQGINVPLSTFPLIFGEISCTLIVQINGDGFDVFMEGKHCARLEHRTPLPNKSCPLMLQFPSTDDYGHPEDWMVYKIWWGNKPIMATDNVSHVAGVNSHNLLHERRLFIKSLPKIHTESDMERRRAEFERAFRKYGGALGVTVTCPLNCSFAFVEVESYRAAEMALAEMKGKYLVSRARKSRHEALMEERAAAEATGGKKEASGWN
mmetsp:Transcript_6475/g.8191  ORF Transcript_6475/g.8191 Transcript_6475/m.8191 type:complete len:536 (+) Transcript_6475:111-1718(+)